MNEHIASIFQGKFSLPKIGAAFRPIAESALSRHMGSLLYVTGLAAGYFSPAGMLFGISMLSCRIAARRKNRAARVALSAFLGANILLTGARFASDERIARSFAHKRADAEALVQMGFSPEWTSITVTEGYNYVTLWSWKVRHRKETVSRTMWKTGSELIANPGNPEPRSPYTEGRIMPGLQASVKSEPVI